ncbi:skin secretory protein xP2 [Calypte anna]|uniref:skin secretory protein xP2 n=1 Tax=Calypte anna TaxID=9244 RepID=UPI0011C3FAA0|nr:skin secretory protein xP2 [Calypte anna]
MVRSSTDKAVTTDVSVSGFSRHRIGGPETGGASAAPRRHPRDPLHGAGEAAAVGREDRPHHTRGRQQYSREGRGALPESSWPRRRRPTAGNGPGERPRLPPPRPAASPGSTGRAGEGETSGTRRSRRRRGQQEGEAAPPAPRRRALTRAAPHRAYAAVGSCRCEAGEIRAAPAPQLPAGRRRKPPAGRDSSPLRPPATAPLLSRPLTFTDRAALASELELPLPPPWACSGSALRKHRFVRAQPFNPAAPAAAASAAAILSWRLGGKSPTSARSAARASASSSRGGTQPAPGRRLLPPPLLPCPRRPSDARRRPSPRSGGTRPRQAQWRAPADGAAQSPAPGRRGSACGALPLPLSSAARAGPAPQRCR